MHIGFHPILPSWQGGLNYLRNLLFALHSTYGGQIQRSLFIPQGTAKEAYAALLPFCNEPIVYQVDQSSRLSKRIIEKIQQRRGQMVTTIVNPSLEQHLQHQGCQVFFMNNLHYHLSTPSLSWIPDFQHLHLKHLFNSEQLRRRDQAFLQRSRLANQLILSSKNARSDFLKFAPNYADKAQLLHFVAQIDPAIYTSETQTICAKYRLPERFVYFPGQFWQHKNHTVAFDAVRILRARGIDITLVCTGPLSDYRQPLYFSSLIQKLTDDDIRDRVIILGLLPYLDIQALMRQSVCTLNPSLFEGWSTTVEEAKTLGKCTVLSDIAVHQEQNPSQARYFAANSSEALADVLGDVWKTIPAGPDLDLEREARVNLPQRTRRVAESFLQIAQAAAG
ncbi:MAG: glycosyltransferase [Cyanobacteria bacterium P01_H01_bin.15]